MTMQTLRLTFTLCALLTLAACGSGTSDDTSTSSPGPLFSDDNGADGNVDPDPDGPSAPGADADGDADADVPENGDGGVPPDENASGEDSVDGEETGEESPGGGDADEGNTEEDEGNAGEEGAGEDAVVDTGSEADGDEGSAGEGGADGEAGADTGSGAEGDEGTDEEIVTGEQDGNAPDVIQPGVPGNLAATRLILGMQRVLKATLLDLNGRQAAGLPLSEQQQACLGSHEAALGEPAFALGCERALATGEIEVYVEQGAFYRTEDCAADLLAGTAERCVMASARMIMRTRFDFPPGSGGQGRPLPVPGSGVVMSYAIDAPTFVVESDERSPLTVFDCAFELQNGALLPSIGGRDVCDAQVRHAADHIDFLAPIVL